LDANLDLKGKVKLFATTYGNFVAKIYDGKEHLGNYVEGLWNKISTRAAMLNHQFRAAVADSSPYKKLVDYFNVDFSALDFHADVFEKNRSVVIDMSETAGLLDDYQLPDRVHPLASVDEISAAIDARSVKLIRNTSPSPGVGFPCWMKKLFLSVKRITRRVWNRLRGFLIFIRLCCVL
jgi:hypothetical protein